MEYQSYCNIYKDMQINEVFTIWTILTPPPPIFDRLRREKKSMFFSCLNIWTTITHVLLIFLAYLRPMQGSIFKVHGTLSLYRQPRYGRQYGCYLACNYSQYIACLKLGVNTKLVFGLNEDLQRVFGQWKSHLRKFDNLPAHDYPAHCLQPYCILRGNMEGGNLALLTYRH